MVKSLDVVFLLVVSILSGCSLNAPHDNPLDPQSSRYTGTGICSGRTVLLNFPAIGIASARIHTIPSTIDVMTDSSGYFQIPDIPAGEYNIIATKNSYTPDTIHLAVKTGEKYTLNFSLNASPEVLSAKILTRKIDQWWPNPVYFADISATVNDPNGISDIDSVCLSVDTLLFPMTYSVTDKNFQLSVNSYQLPSNNIEWLVGKPLTVISCDQMKSIGTSGPFYVSRMIEDEATPDYPKFQDTTSGSPVLQWTPPNVRFFYTYTLSVVRVESGTEVTVWTQDNIENYLSSYPYPSILDKGNYFWTIAVVDEYGNYSRSKESSFVIN